MDVSTIEQVEAALLCISEARERAERAARALRRTAGDPALAAALEDADRRLLSVHGDLMRSAYFPGARTGQLRLAARG